MKHAEIQTKRLQALGIVLGNGGMTERLTRLQQELKAKPSLRRIIDADIEHNLDALRLVKAAPREVTFRDFRELMERRKHDVDGLVDLFRGKIDDPREFFERVMSCQWRNPETKRFEDRSDSVIPYRSVIEFYEQELHYFKDSAKTSQRYCLCGCGSPVFGQYKFARDACRKRLQRREGFVRAEEVVTD